MAKIIETQITHSLGHSNYDRVIEGLGTMREELVDYEEPVIYNDFVRQLKSKMLREELGGDRRELWWFVRKGKLGLIGKSEADTSAVEEEEAQEVGLISQCGMERVLTVYIVPSCQLISWVGERGGRGWENYGLDLET